jgi:hypothetical protein
MLENFRLSLEKDTKNAKYLRKIEEISPILMMHCLKTSDILHTFYQEVQSSKNELTFGVLTVKSSLNEGVLNLHVQRASQLAHFNGSCDPYVKIYIISPDTEYFMKHSYETTKKSKTINPVFEQHFAM